MKITDKTLTLFEDYLNGSLKKDQKIELDKMIKNDQDFSQWFSAFRSAKNAVTILGREDLRESLSAIMNEPYKKPLIREEKVNLKEMLVNIFNEFFIPFDNILTSRSDSEGNDDLLQAMSFYSKGDFKNASKIFKKLYINSSGDPIISFYYGISELTLGNLANSKKLFKKIILINKHPLKELANWYLGLTYLRSGEKKMQQNILNH